MVQNNSAAGSAKDNAIWMRIAQSFGTEDIQTIADKLSISYQAVSKWKKGTALPSRLRFEQISDLTGSSIDWLMTGKDNLTEEERNANRFDSLSNKFGALSPSKRARMEVLIDVLEKELERMETEPDE